jgi:hypothetical protein
MPSKSPVLPITAGAADLGFGAASQRFAMRRNGAGSVEGGIATPHSFPSCGVPAVGLLRKGGTDLSAASQLPSQEARSRQLAFVSSTPFGKV